MTQIKKSSKRSSESQTKIRTMRQGQQKIKLDIKKPLPSLPPLPLPFPPTQKVEQIVTKLVAKPRLARFPNAFIMYRNEYVLYLKSKNYHISMTELSPMISTSWKKEPEYVKETYTKLSSDAEKMYVRETGNTQPPINYTLKEYTSKEYTSKLEPEIAMPKLNDPRHPQLYPTSHYDFFDFTNNYDRLLQFSISAPNGLPRKYPVNGEIPNFPVGTTSSELVKYSLDRTSTPSSKTDNNIIQQDNCFPPDSTNFLPYTCLPSPVQEELRSPTNLSQTSSCYSPTFPPSTPLGEFMNSPSLIGLENQMMSPCSTSSTPSDASFEDIHDISLIFSPTELDDNRFSGFPTPTYTEPTQSSDLYQLYSGQSNSF